MQKTSARQAALRPPRAPSARQRSGHRGSPPAHALAAAPPAGRPALQPKKLLAPPGLQPLLGMRLPLAPLEPLELRSPHRNSHTSLHRILPEVAAGSLEI
jgi:hypothetical protein